MSILKKIGIILLGILGFVPFLVLGLFWSIEVYLKEIWSEL